VAFQLVDDLLGIWADEVVTGKPVGSDLAARKKSLPVVAALTSGTAAGNHLAWLYHRDQVLDEQALEQAAGLIEDAGGRAWTLAEADRRLLAALESVVRADPAPTGADDLRVLAESMTHRDR
jgi:geranylgeranyl diphosphate synthase type I